MTGPARTSGGELTSPGEAVVDGFRQILTEFSPSCLVADAQARRGAVAGFTPVVPGRKIAGPALTLRLEPDELADYPLVLLDARPGDVVVIAGGGQTRTALWGGLMSTLAMKQEIAGVIVDGAVRDTDEIRYLGFPVWCKGTSPRPSPTFVHGRTEPVGVNVPVVVDDQTIDPGDLVIADEIGFTVVRQADASSTLDATRELIAKEEKMRVKIDNGMTVAEVLAEFGQI